jgi:beta-lactamase class A
MTRGANPTERDRLRLAGGTAAPGRTEPAAQPGTEGDPRHFETSLYRSVREVRERSGLERLSIAFFDGETTIQWSYAADEPFHAASTMKLAVLLGVFRLVHRGELGLEEPVHVRNKFMSIIDRQPFRLDLGNADAEVQAHQGRTMTVHELAYWMITKSSNFATNLLVDVVGVPVIQAALRDLGIEGVRVLRGVEDHAAFEAGLNNEVTAGGLLKLLRLIAEERAFSPELSRQMLEILLDQQYKRGIPAGLPKDARVAHKTGNISTVDHDAGIVFLEGRKPYVVVILTQFPSELAGHRAVAEVSRDVFESLSRLAGD